nr:GDSL esterase/lipase At5g22810 [Tanacetum cinerariifolium]
MGIVETSPWRIDVLIMLVASVLIFSSTKGDSLPLVPALFINNQSTGRFCNGKLASDFTGENLGFTSNPPPILSKEANGKNLLLGANFASGGSGYYETTAKLYV